VVVLSILAMQPTVNDEGQITGSFLYEFSYTSAAMAALVKDPQDRIAVAIKPFSTALGGQVVASSDVF